MSRLPAKRSRGALWACLALLAASAASPALAVTGGTRAELVDYSCTPGSATRAGSLLVAARMHALRRASHLSLRALLQAAPLHSRGGWGPVTGGALGRWLHPRDATLGSRPHDAWIVRLPVHGLRAAGRYRLLVSFRWTDAAGHTLGTAHLRTPVCAQPDWRPDLKVLLPVGVGRDPADAAQDVYLVRVRNGGATAAGRFTVRFEDAGAVQDRTVRSLAPARTVDIRFTGPACRPTDPPAVIIDPQDRVPDANRADNAATVACSSSG